MTIYDKVGLGRWADDIDVIMGKTCVRHQPHISFAHYGHTFLEEKRYLA